MPYNVLGDIQTLTLSNGVRCDNPCCILNIDNSVMLMGNLALEGYVGGTAIATLPASMRPTDDIIFPAYLDTGSITPVPVTLTPDGELSIPNSVETGMLYMNGVTFNVCDQYYNADIGNNFSQGTSPLRWDGDAY